MKLFALVWLLIVATAESVEANWLLWKHSFVTRRIEGTPRGLLSPDGNVDKWDLLNAVDVRKECLSALKAEEKKIVDSLAATYPGETVSQATLADGISATVSAGAEKKAGGSNAKTTQLYYEYTLWCLPAAVDPRLTRPQPRTPTQTEKNK